MKWIFTIIIASALIVTTIWYVTRPCEQLIQFVTLIVLGLTLIAIMFYTDATQKHVKIVTKGYEESREPIIGFLLGCDSSWPPIQDKVTGQGFILTDSGWRTPVKLINHSGKDAVVWVTLNFKINDKLYEVGGAPYTGQEPWNLQARGSIQAPGFDIKESIQEATGVSPEDVVRKEKIEQTSVKITLEIIIKYCYAAPKKIYKNKAEIPNGNYYLEKAPLRYYLDLENARWIFDVKFEF